MRLQDTERLKKNYKNGGVSNGKWYENGNPSLLENEFLSLPGSQAGVSHGLENSYASNHRLRMASEAIGVDLAI